MAHPIREGRLGNASDDTAWRSSGETRLVSERTYFQLDRSADDIWELSFDVSGLDYNTFSLAALTELADAVERLERCESIGGLIVRSAKASFCLGMDISEFPRFFDLGRAEIEQAVLEGQAIFNRLEDLPCPTVTLINGVALGGGFEFCLATDYRLVTPDAKVGLPETRLGICPGWGGSVRMPRLAGLDNAIEWICAGRELSAEQAVAGGLAEAVVPGEALLEAGRGLLREVLEGKRDHAVARRLKLEPVRLARAELELVFRTAAPMVAAKAGAHYPAPVGILKCMRRSVTKDRSAAHALEAACFAELATTPQAGNLCAVFLNGQVADRRAKSRVGEAPAPGRAAVIGAGIMGGGIAHWSATHGIPVILKDVSDAALDAGITGALDLLEKGIRRGKANAADRARVAVGIRPATSYEAFGSVDLAVEAIVEDERIKSGVLAECESALRDDAVLTSNTSTLSITSLAEKLKRPAQFCGLHFFNPVHRMALVEIVRGADTSDETIRRATKYALALRKKPIVVNDCPGFLVNRILVPYTLGFALLLRDGVDFERIDRVMERFGWPMGPAALADLVGLDTGRHVSAVMARGYPDRMGPEGEAFGSRLLEAGRLGRKSGAGFYDYRKDRKGRMQKVSSPDAHRILGQDFGSDADIGDGAIVHRTMLPLCIEAARCLEEGIVGTPQELDIALVMGVGFPPFLGGALRYVDSIGSREFVALASKYAALGPLYTPGDDLLVRGRRDQRYFSGHRGTAR